MAPVFRASALVFLAGLIWLCVLIFSPIHLVPISALFRLVPGFFVTVLIDAVLAWVVTLIEFRSGRNYRMRRPGVRTFLELFAIILAVLTSMIAFAGGVFVVGRGLLGLIQEPASRPYALPGVSTCVVLFSGIALFYMRRTIRAVYGAAEVVVGVVVALVQSSDAISSGHTPDGKFVLALTTAGVYLIVRGLDNIEQGLKATPKDPLARVLRRLVPSREGDAPTLNPAHVAKVRARMRNLRK